MFNRTLCTQVHELPQGHCGDNREQILQYIYPHTRVLSFPGLISVARVNEQRKTPGAELHQNACGVVNEQNIYLIMHHNPCFNLFLFHYNSLGNQVIKSFRQTFPLHIYIQQIYILLPYLFYYLYQTLFEIYIRHRDYICLKTLRMDEKSEYCCERI